MLRSTLIVCASAMAFGSLAALPALAQDTVVESQTVTFGDLNLKNPNDADLLINRIEGASLNVCSDTRATRSLAERRDVAPCRADSEQRAVYDVGHPVVTSRYYGADPQVIIEGSYDPEPYAGAK